MISKKQTFSWISPYALCWLSIPFILLPGLLFGQHTLDFQLYDTYYVIAISQYVIAVAILIWVFGVIYWTVNKTGKKLNYMLSFLHLATTILILTIIALPSCRVTNSFETSFAILAVFTTSQIACLANVFLSLLRK